MPNPTPITKPTPLDFTQEKVEIGDTVEFIDKINRMQTEMATFSNELNAMLVGIENHNNTIAANIASDNSATAQAVVSSNQQTAQAVAASAAQFTKATKAQAEAGTDNTSYMTSLRVKEHVDERKSEIIESARAGKSSDSSRLEGKTKAQVIAEAKENPPVVGELMQNSIRVGETITLRMRNWVSSLEDNLTNPPSSTLFSEDNFSQDCLDFKYGMSALVGNYVAVAHIRTDDVQRIQNPPGTPTRYSYRVNSVTVFRRVS